MDFLTLVSEVGFPIAGALAAGNTGYGSTNSNTWTASRRSHIFIGEKV
jgi:hypothetical protein